MHRIWKLLALVALASSAAAAASAQAPLELTFTGTVEPRERTQIANQVTGVVSAVHFESGQHLNVGDPMYSIDDAGYRIDVDAAEAALSEARSNFALKTDIADRHAQLIKLGTGLEAKARQSVLEAEIAQAAVERARAALTAAKLALARTKITAPIPGIARSKIAPGAFVEAEGGTVLAEIVLTDPILVGYQVPYVDRQKALNAANTRSIKTLFANIQLSLKLPTGEDYPYAGKPKFESAQLDAKTGTLTTWGEFPNPDGTLIPGLDVTIISKISAASQDAKE